MSNVIMNGINAQYMNSLKLIPREPVKHIYQQYNLLGCKFIYYIICNNITFKTCDRLLKRRAHLRKVHELESNMQKYIKLYIYNCLINSMKLYMQKFPGFYLCAMNWCHGFFVTQMIYVIKKS